MNVIILLFSWFGLVTGAQLPPPPPPPPIATGDSTCPENGCGSNGTRMTGLATELSGGFAAVTLPSGEHVTLR